MKGEEYKRSKKNVYIGMECNKLVASNRIVKLCTFVYEQVKCIRNLL